ncbi:hypothetical protein ACFST9_09940 [Hymenobacter monticola]|uniref:Ankyrin repeat domain-containing protein n=1 Tax=Hymenobacter monticola TaxID=1705399 RepID=A0ABY4B8H9_9BACT|nr:ankyrin repeat domain-containing protein [Hymenobacter monticola]UOE35479.1 hypothetical protein MTP16_07465 [Hymenobacter monticola]
MKQLVIYLLALSWCSSLAPRAMAQNRRKGSSEAAIFRFGQPLAAGTYSFEPTGLFWFPQPSETQIKPEAFQPDAYFDQKAKPVKLKAGAVRYGAYLLTNGQEYLYALVNGEAGWLRAAVPVPAPLKAQYRTLLTQQRLRSSETGLQLGPEYGYVQITPFNDTNYVLIRNGFDNDFVLHVPTLRVTWRSGGRYEGAEIDFATDQLECHGDLMGGRFRFTRQGQPVPDKPTPAAKMSAEERLLARMMSSPQAHQHILDSLRRNYKPSADVVMGNALEAGKISRVDSLLKRGFKIDSAVYIKGTKLTPLSHAVRLDNLPLMELLLKKGASAARVNRYDIDRRPPICFAKSPAALELLLAHGANLQLLKYVDYYKRRRYPTEYLGDKAELRPILLRHAPDSLFKQFDFYDTMLYRYIWEGDTVGIQKLLDRGASLVKPLRVGLKPPFDDADQRPPLYQAAGRVSMAMFLLRHGARLDNPFHMPLDPEAYVLRFESLPFLSYAEKRLGMKLTTPNNPTFAVLQDTVMMQALMKRGVSINSVDSYGNTALIYAKQWNQNVPVEKFLLRHGADKAIVNKRGGSYLIGRERPYTR